MKKLRVTYNYHSMLHDDFRKHEISMKVGGCEAEECLQEFDACSHHFPLPNPNNFPMLKLLSLICTAQIFLIGDIIAKQERENIFCITDVDVLE